MEIKIGDKVSWKFSKYLSKPLIGRGVVRKINSSTFGSKKRAISVQIEPFGKYCEIFPNRKTTTIALYNCKKIE